MVGMRHYVTKSLSLPSLTCFVQGLRHGFLISEGEGDSDSPDKQEKEFACIHYKTWPVTILTLVGGWDEDRHPPSTSSGQFTT